MLSIRHFGFDNVTKYTAAKYNVAKYEVTKYNISLAFSRQTFRTMGEWLLNSYAIGIKLILIGSVLFGFFQFVTYLLAWSTSPLVQIPALLLWACGVIPLLYRLWWLDLSGERASLTPNADYSETMLLRELLPTERLQ